MTTVRLALGGSETVVAKCLDPSYAPAPAVLVSSVWMRNFEKIRSSIAIRDWVMDSGAFSAANSGKTVVLGGFIDTAVKWLDLDPRLTGVFALDVIGDYAQSYRNAVAMREAGVPVIPTFHYGSPWPELERISDEFDRIALGGLVGKSPKEQLGFCRGVFARVWPKRIHGFGLVNRAVLGELPFHSVDSSSWAGSWRFGGWKSAPGLRTRGNMNVRREIEIFLDLERFLQFRWRREMAQLEGL